MPPRKKPMAAKKPAKKPTKRPAQKPKPRAPMNRNINSLRVHIINGGEPTPPPYAGPDRGSFAFNPVFNMGGPKAQMLPRMNSGVTISASPANRVAEMQTQASDGIFNRFAAGVNPSMGTGTFEAGESSSRRDNAILNELRQIAINLGMPHKTVAKNGVGKLRKFIAKERRKQ